MHRPPPRVAAAAAAAAAAAVVSCSAKPGGGRASGSTLGSTGSVLRIIPDHFYSGRHARASIREWGGTVSGHLRRDCARDRCRDRAWACAEQRAEHAPRQTEGREREGRESREEGRAIECRGREQASCSEAGWAMGTGWEMGRGKGRPREWMVYGGVGGRGMGSNSGWLLFRLCPVFVRLRGVVCGTLCCGLIGAGVSFVFGAERAASGRETSERRTVSRALL
jgi:hypothetical protein